MSKCYRQILISIVSALLTMASAWLARAQDTTTVATAPITITENGLQMLSAEVAGYVERDLTVGAELLVIQAGKVLLHQSFGMSDRDSETAWQNSTTCNIRSMTKAFTSSAAQILIDRGALKLDAPVAEYLPSFDTEATRSITLQQVLTHRSGLPLTTLQTPKQFSSLSEQVAASARAELQFEPGTKFWYSDAGTDVVAALVEKVTGGTIDAFVERELLQPLGMNRTFYGIDATHPQFSEIATLYLGSPKNWSPFWKPADESFYSFAWGSQTLYSTAHDYTKFLSMLLDGGQVGERRILSTAAIRRMIAPTSPMSAMGTDKAMPTGFNGLQPFYGQMLVTYRTDAEGPVVALGHSGSDGTIAWAWPKHDLIIAYFTQSRGGLTPLRMEAAIDRVLFRGAADIEVPERLRPYEGTFVANYAQFKDEAFKVSAVGDKLVLDVPSQMAFELIEPEQGELWPFVIAPDQIQVEFVRNDEGAVTALRMHQGGKAHDVPRKIDSDSQPADMESPKLGEDDLPIAESIIARFVEATGGKAEYTATKSMTGQGSLTIPKAGIQGSVEFIYAEGGKWNVQSDLGVAGSERSGSDGEVAWAQTGTSSARRLQGGELQQAQQEADLQARLHPEKYYESMRTTGMEAIHGEECYRIELKSSSGDSTVEFFSVESGYFVRRISRVAGPVGKIQVIEDFDDYRPTGKRIAWHTSVKHLPGGIDLIMKLEKVQFNQPIDDTGFSMP